MRRPDHRILTAALGLLVLLPACRAAKRPTGARRMRFGTPGRGRKVVLAALKTNDTPSSKRFRSDAEKDLSPGTRWRTNATARSSPSPCRSPGDGIRLAPTARNW